mgnify:CR=1 FL=1
MATLGPQIVSASYGNLLKFVDSGQDGVENGQIHISDGKGKPTPLFLATGSAWVSGTLSASSDVWFSGLTSNSPGHYVAFDATTKRLYYATTSSIIPTSASYALTASHALNTGDDDWTIGSSYLSASGQTNVYIPNKLENGLRNHAQGDHSHAEGADTVASGNYSHAEGRNVSASGTWSHAEGNETLTKANYTHAEGSNTIARGIESHAEGADTLALGNYSHAEGRNVSASGMWSHAEGNEVDANGNYSHAEGVANITLGEGSHAEGGSNIATGIGSHVEGILNTAGGDYSHVQGVANVSTELALGATVAGYGNISETAGQTVVGQFNDYANLNKQNSDLFVAGASSTSTDRRDGLIVRAGTGWNPFTPNEHGSSGVIINNYGEINSGVTLGGTLYFGHPNQGLSHRLVGAGNQFKIQQYPLAGPNYEDAVIASNNVTAVFTTP